MKKIVASVGLAALGASGMQTASAQALETPAPSKPWNVSATLRGFYDDNTSTTPNSATLAPGQKRDSFGYEVSPSASLAWALEQTTISVGYLYSMKYYENKPLNSADHLDQSHSFNVSLDHAFSERYRGKVSDSFVIGQEPDFLRAGNAFSTFQRVSGDNIRNQGAINFDAQLTPLLGLGVGYDNAYYDYADNTPDIAPNGDVTRASLGGSLNRIEHGVHLESLWTVQPQTKALVGAQFRELDYIGDQAIAGNVNAAPPAANAPLFSKDRDSRMYRGYAGVEHAFRPDLTGAVRAGASYIDYYNDPLDRGADVAPYVSTSLKWTYAPESFVDAGFEYDRNATDVVGFNSQNFTLDMESAVFYVSVNHRITPKLFASLTGQFQNNTFNGGAVNGENEQYYLAGLNLEYRFNPFLAAHVGYNYDNLQSQIGRAFDRNRVYIGLTASY